MHPYGSLRNLVQSLLIALFSVYTARPSWSAQYHRRCSADKKSIISKNLNKLYR